LVLLLPLPLVLVDREAGLCLEESESLFSFSLARSKERRLAVESSEIFEDICALEWRGGSQDVPGFVAVLTAVNVCLCVLTGVNIIGETVAGTAATAVAAGR
jgi:hypothetical protein